MNKTSHALDAADDSVQPLATYVELDDLSEDGTWIPSIGSNEDDDDDDPTEWKEERLTFKDFEVNFNKIDLELERSYVQETLQLKGRLLKEYQAILKTKKPPATLTENELLNMFFPAEILMSVVSFMNRALAEKTELLMRFPATKQVEAHVHCLRLLG